MIYIPSFSTSSTASHFKPLGDIRCTKKWESFRVIGGEVTSKMYLLSAFLYPVHLLSNTAKSLLPSVRLKINRVLLRVEASASLKDFKPDQHLSPFLETHPLLLDWTTHRRSVRTSTKRLNHL